MSQAAVAALGPHVDLAILLTEDTQPCCWPLQVPASSTENTDWFSLLRRGSAPRLHALTPFYGLAGSMNECARCMHRRLA